MDINVNLNDASKILFVNSVLSVDKNNNILTEENKRKSNSKLEGENTGTPIQAEINRAEYIIKKIKQNVPRLYRVSQIHSIFSWKIKMIFIVFFGFLGAGFHFFETRNSFHVFSISLFGLIIWNFISIFIIIISPFLLKTFFSFFKKGKEKKSDPESQSTSIWIYYTIDKLKDIYKWPISRIENNRTMETSLKALSEFFKEWSKIIVKIFRYEYHKTVHLSMISFTLSAIIAAFISGLTKSHTVTTASDFLTNNHFRSILEFIFIPSKMILGKLPDLSAIESSTESATQWIFHYMITLVFFVVIPRSILFFWALFKSYRLKTNFPIPKELIFKDTLNIALASHTNTGKTSLLRTLIKRDVGEVSNRENVTKKSSGYFLLNEQNARLKIWDTPGFNNINNLIDNINKNNLDDFLIKFRKRDKFKLNIEALSALKNESDIIIFLVPAQLDNNLDKDTINKELTILKKLNKPIICTVNFLERENNKKNEDSLKSWKDFFGNKHNIPDEYVLPLDAHNRSIEDEALFFEVIEKVAKPEIKELAGRIHTYYKEKKEHQIMKLTSIISTTLIKLCEIYENKSNEVSIENFKKKSDKYVRDAIGNIINIIGLDHNIDKNIIKTLKENIAGIHLDKVKTFGEAVKGGALSGLGLGAVTGILDGGLGAGMGLLVGAVAGGIGTFIISYSYKNIKFKGSEIIIWDEKFIKSVLQQLIKSYLTVSTYGRARGKVINENINKVDKILERSVELSLKTHWEKLWQEIEKYRKEKDRGILGIIVDKINPFEKKVIIDNNIITDKCREILEKSHKNWLKLKKTDNNMD